MQKRASGHARIRAGQIIVLAMLLGMWVFAVLAWVLGPTGQDHRANQVLLWVSIGYMVAVFPLYIGMAPIMARTAARSSRHSPAALDPAEHRAGVLVTVCIIRGALAESAGLFAAVVLLLSGNALCLIPINVATLLLLMAVPTQGKLFSMNAA